MTTQGLAVSGPEVMTAAEWDARRRLAAYLKSDEYKRLRYTAGDAGANQPADAIRREIHGHLAARLALLIREAQAKGPHPDFVAAARSIDALSQGDYVVGPGGRIGVVVRVPVFDSGTSYRAPQKTGHENSIRWIATGTTQGAYGIYGMKPEDLRQVRALGFNERQTVKPAG